MITLTVRSFMGSKFLLFELDPDENVSDVKEKIAKSPLCKGVKPMLEYNGLELADGRTLSYYGVKEPGVLRILPPSKLPRLPLQFEKPDGSQFTLDVKPNITVADLIRYISAEEKLDVHGLKFISSTPDPEDPDIVVVSPSKDLPAADLLSDHPLTGSTILICGPPPPQVPPSTLRVCVALHDDGRKLMVDASLRQSLRDFREAVQTQHGVSISQDVLIRMGKEVSGEDIPIWDHGFVPDCVVHAVPFVSFSVEIIDIKIFDTLLLHPLTKLSAVRKMLTEGPEGTDQNVSLYSFTLDGKEKLKEWRTLWGLDLISGATIYLRPIGVISVVIRVNGGQPSQIDAEEDETVSELKERCALMYNIDITSNQRVTLLYRGKVLQDEMTLKEEGLSGGESLMLHFNHYTPR